MANSSLGKKVTEDYANLSIDEEGEDGLILEEPPANQIGVDYSLCLVGSFLSDRKVNFSAMKDTLASIWRPVKGVYMEETSYPNLFIIKFFHKLDMQRVLDDGPWTFNQQVLLVKKLEGDEQLSELKISELFIWLQIYDLPIGFHSEVILKSIGNYVGKFLSSDPKNLNGVWRNYQRIKVAIDVNKPLKSRMRIKRAGDWLWISFKYERLPSFCFYCGVIGHSEKFCESLFDEKNDSGIRKYDGSLRAPMRGQQGSSKNQWLRGVDGSKLSMAVEVQEDGGEGWRNNSGDISAISHDSRNHRRKLGNQGGSSTVSTIIGEYDREESRDTGMIFSNPKRPRNEASKVDNNETGRTSGLDSDMSDDMDENQKNLLQAGTAMQARQSL